MLGQARRDLRTLREMFALDAAVLLGRVESVVPALAGIWVPWTSPEPVEDSPRRTIARKLEAAEDWGACAELLAGHFARHGAGPYGRHRAFLWREGRLLAVSRPDPVSLAELVAYEREREPLIRNTERFLAGLPAHHALLYGLPGTGKSSTVKAIMNEYEGPTAGRGEERGPRGAAGRARGPCAGVGGVSSSSSTTSPSRSTRSSTRLSRRSSKAASRSRPRTSGSTPPPTAGT